MTEDEMEKMASILANKLAPLLAEQTAKKIQTNVLDSIYKDAGKSIVRLLKSLFWGAIVFLAAWGAASNWKD